tara:strand:+ start:321 stop:422 length:102 start_codon:yes stop_codon:yes gene_type:complete
MYNKKTSGYFDTGRFEHQNVTEMLPGEIFAKKK